MMLKPQQKTFIKYFVKRVALETEIENSHKSNKINFEYHYE